MKGRCLLLIETKLCIHTHFIGFVHEKRCLYESWGLKFPSVCILLFIEYLIYTQKLHGINCKKSILFCMQKKTSLSQIFIYWKIFKTGLFEVWRGRKSYFILLFHHHFCGVDKWWSFFAASLGLSLLPTRVAITQKKEKIIFLPVILLFLSIDLVLSRDFFFNSKMVMFHLIWHRIPSSFSTCLSENKSENPIRLNFHILTACCVSFVWFKAAICA